MENVDYLNEFDVLRGFKFFKAYECSSYTVNEDGGKDFDTFVTVIEFRNEYQVGIDVTCIDGEFQIGDPYAVDVDMQRLKEYSNRI